MDDVISGYMEDLKDSLLTLDDALISIQKSATDQGVINNIFRVAHTIKGNSAAMNFIKIEKVMHSMEDILQEVRSGLRELSPDIVEVLFACHDFLEDCISVISREQSDIGLNTEGLQNKLEQIKTGRTIEILDGKHEDIDVNEVGLENSELLKVIEENCRRGFQVYKLKVTIDPECLMKSIRAWLVFEEVDMNATIVTSNPVRPPEEAFKDGTFSLEGNELQILLLTEKEVGLIVQGIRNLSEISDVTFVQIQPDEIHRELARADKVKEILKIIRDIGVNILDSNSREVNPQIIESILNHLEKISACELPSGALLVKKAASELVKVLQYAIKNGRRLTVEDVEMIAFICNDMETGLGNEGLFEKKEFQEKLDEHLLMIKERCQEPSQRIGDILRDKGLISDKDVEDILKKQMYEQKDLKFGQIAVKENKVSATEIIQTLKEQDHITEKKVNAVVGENGFVRIPVGKVDNLMDMLGELLILNSQMEQRISLLSADDIETHTILSRTAKIIKGVQSLSMSLRMVEIKSTLHRLTRIARDTAAELQKKIVVSLEGEDTEIDRSAAEKIFDPLMHLVRNAVSHGIEDTQSRLEKGKEPDGQITIRAYSKRGNVYVEVSDDGNGMDTDKILKKARDLGMANAHEEYSEEEIIRFVFLPGFSTQDEINSISGRGVGMNVVEEEIKKLGGRVEIQNRIGTGCSFTIRIPMNLAVVNGTIVEVCNGKYIIPTLFIKEFLIVDGNHWVRMQGKSKAVRLRDHVIPVLQPDWLLDLPGAWKSQDRCVMIILEVEQKLLAFPVEKIIARQEVVSKPLGSEFSEIEFATGASILGDGVVSLILDVEDMFKKAGL